MKFRIAIIFLLVFIYQGFSEEDKSEFYLNEAETAFNNGLDAEINNPAAAMKHFAESVMNYEKLINDYNIRNARLYYNLANSYFKLSKMGNSILNYKRALLLRPFDKNIISSYRYAKNNVREILPESDFRKIFKMIFFIHYKLPYHYKIIIFTAFYILFWACLFIYYIKRKKILLKAAVSVFVLFLLFMVSFFYDYYSIKNEGVIITDTIARKGGSLAYTASFSEELLAGTEFTCLEERNGWYYIKIENGETCWVKSDSSELVSKRL